jgi:hypothetical protein
MRRRQVIAILAGAAATWPMAARAQQSQMTRIGVLVIGNADVLSFGKELREGLRELGRSEGQHYVIELRSAEGQLSRLPELAAELVRLKVDVIVAHAEAALANHAVVRSFASQVCAQPRLHRSRPNVLSAGRRQSKHPFGPRDYVHYLLLLVGRCAIWCATAAKLFSTRAGECIGFRVEALRLGHSFS